MAFGHLVFCVNLKTVHALISKFLALPTFSPNLFIFDSVSLNTQYMRNSNFVYVLKMEYVPKINIFGLQMMVTIHHKKVFEIPPCAKKGPFYY